MAPLNRRQLLAGSASLGLLLTGCGGGGGPAAPAGGGFPRTLATSRGPVEIPVRPERIVTLAAEVDVLVALGRTPTAMIQSFNAPGGIDPWLTGRIDPAMVTLLDSVDGVPFEQVAAARPDVILAGTHFPIDEDEATLVGIAPVVTTVRGLTQDTWQDQVTLVGEALGEETAAATAVADTEARVAEVRAGHPGWAGRTFASAYANQPGSVRVGAGASFGPRFLTSLGLTLAPAVTGLPGPDIAYEQLGMLDADVLLVSSANPELRQALAAAPVFANLGAVRAGRIVEVDIAMATALAVPSILRVGHVLDELVPAIEGKLGT